MSMNFILILPQYVVWHYGMAIVDIQRIAGNFLRFFYNLFSVRLLASTLFAPWQKVSESAPKGADLGDVVSNLIFNGIMRGIGFVVRLTFILIGLTSMAVGFVLAIVFFILWIILPFAVVTFFVVGFKMILQ